MKHIKKTISLESFKSRLPLLMNSFDKNGNFINFEFYLNNDNYTTDEIYSKYINGNYNMLPCDIKFTYGFVNDETTGVTKLVNDITTRYCNTQDELGNTILDKTYCFEPNKWFKTISSDTNNGNIITEITKCTTNDITIHYTASYKTIRDMYYFFLKYDDLLNSSKVCKKTTNDCQNDCLFELLSATEYYKIYIKDESFYDEYETMDKIYYSFGGDSMKHFLYDYIFKSFVIPSDYRNFWGCSKLWYLDALKWHKWFSDRYDSYQNITELKDCVTSENCCDCEEYFKRGGHEMYFMLKSFIETFNTFNFETDVDNTSIDLDILLTNSIDDMGEFSIFSNEWEGGENYMPSIKEHPNVEECLLPNDINEYLNDGTTVVLYNNCVYINLKEKEGFEFNSDCMEFEFNEDDWGDYTLAKHSDSFSSYTYYAYDKHDNYHLITGNGFVGEDLKQMSEKYIINEKEYIIYNNDFYDVNIIEYIILNIPITGRFVKQIKLQVFTDRDRKKYVTYKNRKYYAKFINGVLKIIFPPKVIRDEIDLKTSCDFTNDEINVLTGKSVTIGDTFFIFDNNKVKINNEYYFLNNHYVTINSTNYSVKDGKLVNILPSKTTTIVVTDVTAFGDKINNFANASNQSFGYIIENNYLYILEPFQVYEVGKITGTTSSKLSMFIDNKLIDDVGNEINGYFKVDTSKFYAQPLENETIDFLFHINSVCNLTPVSIKDDETIVWGNILYDIEFYYVDENEKIIKFENAEDKFKNGFISVRDTLFNGNNLLAIKKASDLLNATRVISNRVELIDEIDFNDDLRCKITYYIGAILKLDNGKYVLYTDNGENSKFTQGVKYTEDYKVIKLPTTYSISKNISYNIFYYNLEPINYTKSLYRTDSGTDIEVANPKTNFEMYVNNTFIKNNELTYTKYNSTIYAPVFREEYKFGISMPEKVYENIFIDRGIIKAMDKMLKLVEITTFEDLEQYGNKFFTIKEG